LSSPISLNPYAYANNNPVNNTDPSGYFSIAEVNVTQVINGILSGAAYGSAFSGASNFLIQNVQIYESVFITKDGKKTEIDGKQLLDSLWQGAGLGAFGGGLGFAPPLFRLLGFGIFAGLIGSNIVDGANDIGQGYVTSGISKIVLALLPFRSKEALDTYPSLKAEFNRLAENLAGYNIKLSRSESGAISVKDAYGMSIELNTNNHVTKFDGFSQKKGINGTHNQNEFMKAVENNNVSIVETVEHPTIKGLSEITYRIPAVDSAGNPTGNFKSGTFRKTVYDPSIISDARMMGLAQEAATKGYQQAIEQGKGAYDAQAGGINFRTYLNNDGSVRNIHPLF
jgi:hypothetical protein